MLIEEDCLILRLVLEVLVLQMSRVTSQRLAPAGGYFQDAQEIYFW